MELRAIGRFVHWTRVASAHACSRLDLTQGLDVPGVGRLCPGEPEIGRLPPVHEDFS